MSLWHQHEAVRRKSVDRTGADAGRLPYTDGAGQFRHADRSDQSTALRLPIRTIGQCGIGTSLLGIALGIETCAAVAASIPRHQPTSSSTSPGGPVPPTRKPRGRDCLAEQASEAVYYHPTDDQPYTSSDCFASSRNSPLSQSPRSAIAAAMANLHPDFRRFGNPAPHESASADNISSPSLHSGRRGRSSYIASPCS
jgi:hypothetical protein